MAALRSPACARLRGFIAWPGNGFDFGRRLAVEIDGTGQPLDATSGARRRRASHSGPAIASVFHAKVSRNSNGSAPPSADQEAAVWRSVCGVTFSTTPSEAGFADLIPAASSTAASVSRNFT